MAELISPTIDLFLYDSRNELGQTWEELQENREYFAKKLPGEFAPLLWQKDNGYETEFVELLGEKMPIQNLPFASKEYQGYFYPVRLQDTYGLLLSCTVKERDFPYPVSCLHEMRSLIETTLQEQTATIGQTWIISAYLESSTHQGIRSLARECYHALTGNENWGEHLTHTSHFFGGTLFELWQYDLEIPEEIEDENWDALDLGKFIRHRHVLITIYPDRKTAVAAQYFLAEWMQLLCHRHKILWHYAQSKVLKQLLESDILEIDQYLEKSQKFNFKSDDLPQLSEHLQRAKAIFTDYSVALQDFQLKIAGIEGSLYRYGQQIEAIAESFDAEQSPVDLTFLQQFAKLAERKYLRLLQKDYENLSGGLKFLESSRDWLQIEVEMSRAKRDRTFQNAALTVGTGVGCGLITAAIATPTLFPEPKQIETASAHPLGKLMVQTLSLPEAWLVPAIPLALSLGVAMVTGSLIAVIAGLRSRF